MSVSEILHSAESLEPQKLDELFKELSALRLQRNGTTLLTEREATLLHKVNTGFNPQQLDRLKYLDWKSEFGALSPEEEIESLQLAEAFEAYSAERLQNLAQLAVLRRISIDQLVEQLDLKG